MAARTWYTRFAKFASRMSGKPLTFFLAALLIAAWLLTGPIFGFSNTWQLVINTLTTIVTFLMVFVIQTTQNRDTEAMHLKLDELIRATKGAHNTLLDLEEHEDRELDEMRARYEQIATTARARKQNGETDTDTPEP